MNSVFNILSGSWYIPLLEFGQ